MDEYLNELIAYLVIGAVAIFVAVVASVAIRRRLRIRRWRQRHRRSAARVPDRPAMVVIPAAQPQTEELEALEFFLAFEDRLAEIRAEIDALDVGAVP